MISYVTNIEIYKLFSSKMVIKLKDTTKLQLVNKLHRKEPKINTSDPLHKDNTRDYYTPK